MRLRREGPDEVLRFAPAGDYPEVAFSILVAVALLSHALAITRSWLDRAATYAGLLSTMAAAWPGARRAAIGRLNSFVRGLDAESALRAWPTLMRLRGEP